MFLRLLLLKRLGIGITLSSGPAEAPDSAGSAENDGFEGRLQKLETQLRDLQLRMDAYVRQNENVTGQSSDQLFARLGKLLFEERKNNAKLLQRCTKLELENRVLRLYRNILRKLRQESE